MRSSLWWLLVILLLIFSTVSNADHESPNLKLRYVVTQDVGSDDLSIRVVCETPVRPIEAQIKSRPWFGILDNRTLSLTLRNTHESRIVTRKWTKSWNEMNVNIPYINSFPVEHQKWVQAAGLEFEFVIPKSDLRPYSDIIDFELTWIRKINKPGIWPFQTAKHEIIGSINNSLDTPEMKSYQLIDLAGIQSDNNNNDNMQLTRKKVFNENNDHHMINDDDQYYKTTELNHVKSVVCIGTLFKDCSLTLSQWMKFKDHHQIFDEVWMYVDYSELSSNCMNQIQSFQQQSQSGEIPMKIKVIPWNTLYPQVWSYSQDTVYQHCGWSQKSSTLMINTWVFFLDSDDFLSIQNTHEMTQMMISPQNDYLQFHWIEYDYCCMFQSWFDEDKHAKRIGEAEYWPKYAVKPRDIQTFHVHNAVSEKYPELSSKHQNKIQVKEQVAQVRHHRCRKTLVSKEQTHCLKDWESVLSQEFGYVDKSFFSKK